MRIVAVTGSKGKTTVAHMIWRTLRRLGVPAAILSSTLREYGGRREEILDPTLTMPPGDSLRDILLDARAGGETALVMEATSWGLARGWLDPAIVDAAVLTCVREGYHVPSNHATLDEYLYSKKLLFSGLRRDALAVVNFDDPRAVHFARATSARIRGFGSGPGRTYSGEVVRAGRDTTEVLLKTPRGPASGTLQLVGDHQLYNALAAVAVLAETFGIDPQAALDSISLMLPVPGRLQPVSSWDGRYGYVDYGHPVAALRSSLRTLRRITPGRLILVFGCPGDRSDDSRARFGSAASHLADLVIITEDSPRSERQGDIAASIVRGMDGPAERLVIHDRSEAIERALRESRQGDAILVSGRGVERLMEIQKAIVEFDDREELASAFDRARAGCPTVGACGI